MFEILFNEYEGRWRTFLCFTRGFLVLLINLILSQYFLLFSQDFKDYLVCKVVVPWVSDWNEVLLPYLQSVSYHGETPREIIQYKIKMF